jgi:hypothetical protein
VSSHGLVPRSEAARQALPHLLPMRMHTKRCPPSGSVLLLFTLLGASCASTSLQGVWKAPDTGGKANKILVIGLTRNDTGRRALERQFVSRLSQEKRVAVDSSRYVPEGGQLDRAKVEEIVKREGFDAVVLSRLVDVHREAQYVPSGYATYGGAGFYGYYGYGWSTVYSPGYVTESTNVQVETQLFRVNGGEGKLVWSTVSETMDPSSVEKAASGIAGAVVDRMAEDKVL